MRKSLLLIISALVLGTASPASAIQCVPYAREVSGIDLKGDAWQWWAAATGRYDRGRTPKDGAVLVFSRQGNMRYGHVSVVTRVVSSRLVLVDHANWAPMRGSGRGEITTAVPVLDVSPKNDWSQIRVWYHPVGDFGSRVYKAEGYVYQPNTNKGRRPVIQQAALKRAAEIYPNDHGLARHAKPVALESSKDEAQAPKLAEMTAQAVAKASVVDVATADAGTARQAEPAHDMVRVAKTVFRSRSGEGKSQGLNGLLFN